MNRLSNFTTFRLGGPCRELATVADAAAAAEVVCAWNAARRPWRIMGGGSNLLVADAGIPENVLRFATDQADVRLDGGGLCVSAAAPLDALAEFAAEEGWAGLGFAAGIPGTVGGGLCGNAGAFGRQLGDVLDRVEILTRAGDLQRLARAALAFGYRASALPASGAVVVRAWFRTAPGDRAALRAERAEILALRRDKHPDWRTVPTAGSFFKNLPPAQPGEPRRAAGKYLEQAGAKTMRAGGACVFEKHANIVVAGPGATARDVATLAGRMAAAVRARFGFDLEPEVRFWGAV
ncbi:MAG: UDP-N-acetylmuramate dehydrogenase [Kiritimatiellia bacterium]